MTLDERIEFCRKHHSGQVGFLIDEIDRLRSIGNATMTLTWKDYLIPGYSRKAGFAKAIDDEINAAVKRCETEKNELITILEKIATLRHSNNSAASIAQSALDTMKALEK